MAKWCSSLVLDNGLVYLRDNANLIHVCSSTIPSNYTEASATYNIGTTALTTGGGGDWTIADYATDSSGRQITCSSKTMAISTSGEAWYVAVTSSDTLLYVTTVSTQALSSGGNVTVPAWIIALDATT